MTKITFKKGEHPSEKIKTGDWFIVDSSGTQTLCVLSQTSAGVINLIAITEDDANRQFSDGTSCKTIRSITHDEFLRISDNGKARKVQVEIIVTE